MRIEPLLPRQSSDTDCIKCPDPVPCNCGPNQDCFQINRDCHTCSQTKCVDRQSSSNSSSGVSKGALAGGVVAALFFFTFALGLFLWYRRRSRQKGAKAVAVPDVKKDVPAPAETVLNRPDPIEKLPPTELNTVRRYTMSTNTTINLDPESQDGSTHTAVPSPAASNPFDDVNSIQTAGTEGTNVIPIALVQPESLRSGSSHSATSASSSQPSRPTRSPELNLNLDHVNVSRDTLRAPNYPVSTRSGSSRNSYMSSASYSSDFLNEAPMIVTPTKTAVRQVLGVVKAEVISAGSLASTSSEGLKPPTTRPAVGSPLAFSSFGPQDIVKEADESQEASNPFGDNHSSINAITLPSAQDAARTERESTSSSKLALRSPKENRPSSISTQAGSLIDIGSATLVNLSGANSPNGIPPSPYRTTVGRLVSPASLTVPGTLQEQQQRALAHAQARAQAQGLDKGRRTSGSSVVSAASTRAYSILESFPFVPPSPISDRPVRSPPHSPHAQQAFTAKPSSPSTQRAFNAIPRTPFADNKSDNGTSAEKSSVRSQASDADLPSPPDRRTLGLSTVSTSSSGLGSFPFQIETGPSSEGNGGTPIPTNGRQRASLDTLALTSDLTSYPLGFDRDSVRVPLPPLPKNT